MNELALKFKNSKKAKTSLKWLSISLLFLFLLYLPIFSGHYPYNLVGYLLALLMVGSIVAYAIIFGYKPRIDYRFISMACFICIAFIATLFYSHNYRAWLTICLLGITYFAYLILGDTDVDHELLLTVFIIAISIFSIIFFVTYFDDIIHAPNIQNIRLGSKFNNVNEIGEYFQIGAIAAFYQVLIRRKNKLSWLYFIPFLVFVFLGILTGSRAFVVTVITGCLVLSFCFFGKKSYFVLLLIPVLLLLVIILMFIPQLATIKKRFIDMMNVLFGFSHGEMSTETRVLWMKYGFYLGLKNQLIGLGAEGFNLFSGVGGYTHSDFSEIFCNFGIIGFCLFYSLWFFSFKNARHYNDKRKFFGLAFLIASIIGSFVYVRIGAKVFYFGLAMALLMSSPPAANRLPASYSVVTM